MRHLVMMGLLAVAAPALAETVWDIDPAHTSVQFSIRHMMISNVRGEFSKVSGMVRGDQADPTRAQVEATIDTSSIDTREPKRDEHLRSADFFDAERYPTVTFRSTRVHDRGDGEFTLEGELTVRDSTRPVTLQGEYLGSQDSPWGDTRVGFTAETEINRKDWGLSYNVALETGGVLVGDKIKLTIDAEWVKE